MRTIRTILGIIVCVIGLYGNATAQVVLPDNMEVTDCVTDIDLTSWGVSNSWSSSAVVSNFNIPLVGDLDGDGHPEVVCFSKDGDVPDDPRKNNRMLVFDGVTKQLKATIQMTSYVTAFDAAAYGLVKLSDGKGLIVAACYDLKLRAYDISSPNPSVPYWVSDTDYGVSEGDWAVNVGFADFNDDGQPEVCVRNKIYNAGTGVLLLSVGTTNTGSSYAHFTHFTHWKLSSPTVANVLGDGVPRLVLGNEIYGVSIVNTGGPQGNTSSLLKQTAPPSGVPSDGHAQVADFNNDGHLDVFVSVRNTDGNQGTVYGYVWDVFNESVSTPFAIATSFSGKSIPMIADIDNDGKLEVLIQSGVSGSGQKFQAYKYNALSQSFSLMWGLSTDENSYANGITSFDFNQDGLLELIVCDQSTLRIVNGSGKSHLTHHDTLPVYVLNSLPYTEITIMQYPVVADVDADGSAEIVSVGSYKLNFFKSSGQPWAPARPVWNQYMYNVTNVNKDLTIPVPLFDNATAFTDPQGVVRRPFNNFLQQATTLDQYGRPFMNLANLSIASTPSITYEGDNIQVTITICNTGELMFEGPLYVSTYTSSGDLIQTTEVSQSLQPGECVPLILDISVSLLATFENPYPLRVSVNDQGEGAAQYGGLQSECDTSDNSIQFDGRPCQVTVPNVITPNGDGFNDAFVPQLEGDFVSLEMEIYNRWGKRVYAQAGTQELSWDAAGLPNGVYYCAIEYRCVVNGNKKRGINTSVTVVR